MIISRSTYSVNRSAILNFYLMPKFRAYSARLVPVLAIPSLLVEPRLAYRAAALNGAESSRGRAHRSNDRLTANRLGDWRMMVKV